MLRMWELTKLAFSIALTAAIDAFLWLAGWVEQHPISAVALWTLSILVAWWLG